MDRESCLIECHAVGRYTVDCHKGMKGGDHESHRVYGKEGIGLSREGMEAVLLVKGRGAVYDGGRSCLRWGRGCQCGEGIGLSREGMEAVMLVKEREAVYDGG